MSLKYSKSSLIVKNLSNKDIKILGMKVKKGKEVDLFKSIVGLSEDRVIAAMQKPNGDLYKAVVRGDLAVSGSSMVTFENDTGITIWETLLLTSDYTAITGSVLLCDCSDNDIIITLPLAISTPGRMLQIKKIDATSNTVTVQCSGSNSLDGLDNFVIEDENVSLSIVSSGNNYYII